MIGPALGPSGLKAEPQFRQFNAARAHAAGSSAPDRSGAPDRAAPGWRADWASGQTKGRRVWLNASTYSR